MSTCIIVSGVAGVGKSTWIQNYIKESYLKSITVLDISLDDLRFQMFGKYSDLTHQEEKAMWVEVIKEAVEGSSKYQYVIIDSTALKNKRRMWYYNQLKNYFNKFMLIIFNASLETCLIQNRQRDRQVPNRVIEDMYNYKEEPNEEVIKSYDNILRINKK